MPRCTIHNENKDGTGTGTLSFSFISYFDEQVLVYELNCKLFRQIIAIGTLQNKMTKNLELFLKRCWYPNP